MEQEEVIGVEVRLRCLEAAARNPAPHADGYTAGVLEAAQKYAHWVACGALVLPDKTPDSLPAEGVGSLM